MRQTKFRGKDEKGNWWYGYYLVNDWGEHTICGTPQVGDGSYGADKVIADTVGQYTGFKDKNGKEIYEGDIVSVNEKGLLEKSIYEVKWFGEEDYPAFDLVCWEGDANGFSEIIQSGDWEIKVIGNIYENPELLNNQ